MKRYIDDGFGFWRSNPDLIKDAEAWAKFQNTLNNCGANWTFSKLSRTAVFLDQMNIWLEGNNILTSMFFKPLNLYLYIPPHSCHSHGIIRGLVHGHFIRIHILCSEEEDHQHHEGVQTTYSPKGSTLETMIPTSYCLCCYLLKQMLKNTPAFFSGKDSKPKFKANRNVYFRVTFHPSHLNKEIKEA